MRKFLIISFTSEQAFTGGMQCSLRNIQAIQTLFGEENVHKYTIQPYKNKRSIKTIFKRIWDIFNGYMGGLDSNKQNEIISTINKEQITDVFVDSSLLGTIVKTIKKNNKNTRVYTYFHNIEYEFVKDHIKVNKDYLRFYWLLLARFNEKKATKYSDKLISLNYRDSNAIQNYYNRVPDAIIPITLKDTVGNETRRKIKSENKKALFIGSYFFANIQGIKWLCANILPHTNIQLTIVGASMDRIKSEICQSAQVQIYSNVPDLTPFYEDADFVLLPILSGSGMKVKTAESLMHGKFIIGTEEAFRGYDISPEIGISCNSAMEFINTINNLKIEYKFNEASRKLYNDKYSFESSLGAFKCIFKI